jgi:hypothetical protein
LEALANGVKSSLMKWVAAGEAAKAEPHAAEGAVTLDRFDHVFGARGMEAAGGRNHRGDPSLIDTKGAYKKVARNGAGLKAGCRLKARPYRIFAMG